MSLIMTITVASSSGAVAAASRAGRLNFARLEGWRKSCSLHFPIKMKIPARHIRDAAVIPDTDLAATCGVPVRRLTGQMKRNKGRFPELGFHVRERTATYRVKRRRP